MLALSMPVSLLCSFSLRHLSPPRPPPSPHPPTKRAAPQRQHPIDRKHPSDTNAVNPGLQRRHPRRTQAAAHEVVGRLHRGAPVRVEVREESADYHKDGDLCTAGDELKD